MPGFSQLTPLNAIDYSTMTVSNAALTFASATPALIDGKVSGKTVRRCLITTETDAVRWRADGTAPTDTEGHLIPTGTSISMTGANYKQWISKVQFIRVTNDAALKITWFD